MELTYGRLLKNWKGTSLAEFLVLYDVGDGHGHGGNSDGECNTSGDGRWL